MAMMTLICPKCGATAKLSLAETSYTGPRRCWKCHEFFTITIHNNQVVSCEPLSQEEYERQQAEKAAREKMRGSVSYASQEKPKTYQKPPLQPQMEMEFPSKDKPEIFPKSAAKPQSGAEAPGQDKADFFQSAPATSRGGIEFTSGSKPEDAPKPPEKPQGGIEFSKGAKEKEPDIFNILAGKKKDSPKPSSYGNSPLPADTGKPLIFPPERYNTFVPQENLDIAPEQSPKSKLFNDKKPGYMKSTGEIVSEQPTVFPPERFNTFVPLEDDDKPDKP